MSRASLVALARVHDGLNMDMYVYQIFITKKIQIFVDFWCSKRYVKGKSKSLFYAEERPEVEQRCYRSSDESKRKGPLHRQLRVFLPVKRDDRIDRRLPQLKRCPFCGTKFEKRFPLCTLWSRQPEGLV